MLWQRPFFHLPKLYYVLLKLLLLLQLPLHLLLFLSQHLLLL